MDDKILSFFIGFDLKSRFDLLLQSISGVDLPDYLKGFEEFQKLDIDVLIQALYNDIALKAKQSIVLENVHELILEILKVRGKKISPESYKCIKYLTAATRALKGEKHHPVDAFIEQTNEFLFVFNPLKDNVSSADIVKEVEDIFKIIQKSSDLYYQKKSEKKEDLKNYLMSISRSLLYNIHQVLHVVLKNPSSKEYSFHLDFILTHFKKMAEVKGVSAFFGDVFLITLKNHEHTILSTQKVDRFLADDLSGPISQKKEKNILDCLNVFSVMGAEFLEVRVNDAFKYHYQVHSILKGKISNSFRKSVVFFYEKFKQDLYRYTQNFNFENQTENNILLTILGVIVSGIDVYKGYHRNIKFALQVKVKNNYANARTDLNQYICFFIEALNYISFSQGKGLNVEISEITQLSKKLTDIRKINDAHVKYFIQEGMQSLLEYFAKNIIISIPALAVLDEKQSIEELSSLLKETNNVLLYLDEFKNFHDVFLTTIRGFSPEFRPNETIKNFLKTLEDQRKNVEQKINTVATALQQKLNIFAGEKTSAVVDHFSLINQGLDSIEKTLKEERARQLHPLIAQAILVIINYFRLNALGYVETIAKDYVKKYCYRAKLKALSDAIKEEFPEMDLKSPKTWASLLQTVFNRKDAFDYQILIFIVGVSYEVKEEYQIAKEFYDYCLKYSGFEIPTKKKEGMYLIEESLIKDHVKVCKEKMNINVPQLADFSCPVVVPSVFENLAIPNNSTSVIGNEYPIRSPSVSNSV